MKTPTAAAGFFVEQLALFEGELEGSQAILVRHTTNILNEQKLRLELYRQKSVSAVTAHLHARQEQLLKLTGDARFRIQQLLRSYDQLNLKLLEQMKSSARYMFRKRVLESDHLKQRFRQLIRHHLESEKKRLEKYQQLVAYAEPGQILKMGFSVSRQDGKALKDAGDARAGALIETELYLGKLKSKITDIQKKDIL
jgi:exodeoxyribonuclease VII large subunit